MQPAGGGKSFLPEKLMQEIQASTAREQTLKCELAATTRKLELQMEANMETNHVFEQHAYDIWLTKKLVNSHLQQFDVFGESFQELCFLKQELNDVLKALRHLQKSESRLERLVEDLQLALKERATEINSLKALLERSNVELEEQKRSHSINLKEMRLERDILSMKLQETALQLEELYQQQQTWVLHIQGIPSTDGNLVSQLRAEVDIWRHLYQDIHDKTCLRSAGTSYHEVRPYLHQKRASSNFLVQLGTYEEPVIGEPMLTTHHASQEPDNLQHELLAFPSIHW
ncbi:hyaluronan-mediated motility receptor-like isoform X2 [Ambystoma mexicanum]|uniref:hyaluronan-mediated motility receptor-like isoform X2 n=1 Tax=Ambystoma mexicanum TaxID=8296 RepID=UPI0037E970B4